MSGACVKVFIAGALLAGAWLTLGTAGCRSADHADEPYETAREELGRDTAAAKRLHLQALELIASGDAAQAEARLRDALKADITFGPAHNNLGKLLFDQGRLYAAAWEFQYAAKLMPYRPEPRNNLGMVFERAGKLDDAVGHYRQALKIEPDNPQLIGNLARAKHRRGDRDAEQRSLLEGLILKDTRPNWRRWAQTQIYRIPED